MNGIEIDIVEFLKSFTIFGLPGLGVVWALVEVYKRLFPNSPPNRLPYVSTVAGLIVAALMLLIRYMPQVEGIIVYLFVGLMMGLATMGLHSGIKALRGFFTAPPGSTIERPDGVTIEVPEKPGDPARIVSNTPKGDV